MMVIGAELFWLIMIMGNLFITFLIATKVEQIVRLVIKYFKQLIREIVGQKEF